MTDVKLNGTKKYQAVGKTEFAEFVALRPNRYGETSWPAAVGTHEILRPDPRAAFAMVCIEKWGMVAAACDGEDSAGRAKLRAMTAQEVVQKACSVADEAFTQFKSRGWFTAIPTIQELADVVKDQENTND